MAIAFDASSNVGFTSGTTHSFSHTCTGDDRFLLVPASSLNNGTNNAVTGVTYNGASMTLERDATQVGTFNWMAEQYYLVAPSTGTNTCTITRNSGTGQTYGSAISYTGVDQTSPIDATTTASGTGSPITTTLSSTTDNCWFIVSNWNADGTPSASTNSTARVNNNSVGALFDFGPKTPAGSLNMQQTFVGTRAWRSFMIAIKPATAGAAPTPTLMMMGVGT